MNIFTELEFKKSFELKADTEIPALFKDLKLNKNGKYVWGVASNSDVDAQGERVKLDASIAPNLERAPYNKLYLEHDHAGKNTGMGSVGLIKFSRVVPEMDNQHIILAEINDSHPMVENIWGSIQNGNIDSFSVAGKADRKLEFNPETGKTDKVAEIKDLRETSLTSMPANAAAGIVGTFIAKNKMEALKMEENNFVPMETYAKDMGEIKEGIKALTDTVGRNAEAMKGMHEGFTQLKKDLDEGYTEDKPEDKPAEDAPAEDAPKEEEKEAKAPAPKIEKKDTEIAELKKELEEVKKSLSKRVGVAHQNRFGEDFEKTVDGYKYAPQTPIMDMLTGGKQNV